MDLELKRYLDRLHSEYDSAEFIKDDPISVPHRYVRSEDIEIAGFLAATIAWGNRKVIVRNSHRMVDMMDDAPLQFVMQATEQDMVQLDEFVHRTFNHIDFKYFILSLRNIYTNHGGLGGFFQSSYLSNEDLRLVLSDFYKLFFQNPVEARTKRHVSSIDKGATCKRLCMYLKWMVRRGSDVDFGLWMDIPSSALYLPIDVHSGNTSRALGLLQRKQNDWKAVEEVTASLRVMCVEDPVKYDFSLFCAGINKL